MWARKHHHKPQVYIRGARALTCLLWGHADSTDDVLVETTVFELAGEDCAGLLADVTHLLTTNGCNVRSAAVRPLRICSKNIYALVTAAAAGSLLLLRSLPGHDVISECGCLQCDCLQCSRLERTSNKGSAVACRRGYFGP